MHGQWLDPKGTQHGEVTHGCRGGATFQSQHGNNLPLGAGPENYLYSAGEPDVVS